MITRSFVGGCTPVHLLLNYAPAVGKENLEDEVKAIVELLIKTNPMALKKRDRNGRLPLHFLLCRQNLPIKIYKLQQWLVSIIAPYPEALVSENNGGVTPFQGFWDNYVRDRISYPENVAKCYYDDTNLRLQSISLWKCLLVIIFQYSKQGLEIRFAANGNSQIQMPLHELASSSLTTPEIMSLGASIHHRELDRLDSKGNTPLHCACTHNRIHNASILARVNPDAARARNVDGYLPVFLALSNGTSLPWKDGLKEIVEANPDALLEKDPSEKCYPFMLLASVAKGVCERARLEALECAFEMIRLCPDLITTKKGREAL